MFHALAGRTVDSDDAHIRTRTMDARVLALFDAAAWPMLGGLIYSIFVVPRFAPSLPSTLLYGWLAWRCLSVALRMATIVAFRRDRLAAQRSCRWLTVFTAAQIPDTLGWAAMPILFMPLAEGMGAQNILASVVGVGAIGAITTWHHAVAGFTFVIVMTLPLVVNQFLLGSNAAAVGLSVYGCLLCIEVWRAHLRLGGSLRVQICAETLAGRLKEALAAAEVTGKAKMRFLAAASHELRTPLNGVVGMAQLIRADMPGRPEYRTQLHRLDVLNRSASHLQVLINDLVDLARLDAGRLELRPEPVSPSTLLRDVVELLNPLAQTKGLAMTLTLAPDLPEAVRVDAARLRQVLFNLIGNAVKFTPAGRVGVVLRATPGGLVFDIFDTGAGIPEHLLERVFDPFEQAGAEAAARRSGSGLGLTISRELARAMGGDVCCRSAVGQGSTFVLTIQAVRCAMPQATEAGPATVRGPLPAAHVLIADDNPVNILVAEGMLKRLGLTFDSVSSGAEALSQLAARHYDAVLMDCLMPDVDGYEATRRWRAQERASGSRAVPIIALTASAVAGDRETCLEAGMDDYLAKPFQLEALAQVLGQRLMRQTAAVLEPDA